MKGMRWTYFWIENWIFTWFIIFIIYFLEACPCNGEIPLLLICYSFNKKDRSDKKDIQRTFRITSTEYERCININHPRTIKFMPAKNHTTIRRKDTVVLVIKVIPRNLSSQSDSFHGYWTSVNDSWRKHKYKFKYFRHFTKINSWE